MHEVWHGAFYVIVLCAYFGTRAQMDSSNSTSLKCYELLSRNGNRSHNTERHGFNLTCCLADAQFFLPATNFVLQKTKLTKVWGKL